MRKLIDSAKLYNYVLCSKAQEAIESSEFSQIHSFFLFNETKKNKTIHQIQKLEHVVKSVKNFSASVLQHSNLDDFLTAKNLFLESIDDFKHELAEK